MFIEGGCLLSLRQLTRLLFYVFSSWNILSWFYYSDKSYSPLCISNWHCLCARQKTPTVNSLFNREQEQCVAWKGGREFHKLCIFAYAPMMLLSDLLNKLSVGKTWKAKTDTLWVIFVVSQDVPSSFTTKIVKVAKYHRQRDCAVGGTHSTYITEWCLIKERVLSSPIALLHSIDSNTRWISIKYIITSGLRNTVPLGFF